MKTLLLLVLLAQTAVWSADEHKAGMNDASDLQEDIRDAVASKSADKVAAAAAKLEGLMAKTEDYWAAKKQGDVVKLAQATRGLARQLAADGKAGNVDRAADMFGKMNASCNTCHDLHPEKR